MNASRPRRQVLRRRSNAHSGVPAHPEHHLPQSAPWVCARPKHHLSQSEAPAYLLLDRHSHLEITDFD
jgi:hypothetical protein